MCSTAVPIILPVPTPREGVNSPSSGAPAATVVDSNAAGAIQEGPPSFKTVAHSGMTADQLRAFLSHPHGAMPDLALTRAEIDDLIGYIDTLR